MIEKRRILKRKKKQLKKKDPERHSHHYKNSAKTHTNTHLYIYIHKQRLTDNRHTQIQTAAWLHAKSVAQFIIVSSPSFPVYLCVYPPIDSLQREAEIMELQNTVKEALNALYHHPDDAVRMHADRWLQDFQRTIDAWQVISALHPQDCRFFFKIFELIAGVFLVGFVAGCL